MTGRPSSFRTEFSEQARKLCELGATDLDIANFFEVDVRTIYRWKLDHEDFCQALKRGKEVADDMVEERLFQRAMGYNHEAVKIFQFKGRSVTVPYTEHYPPDTAACIFWLTNRRKDKWRQRQEHTGPEGGPIQHTHEIADAFTSRIARLASRAAEDEGDRESHA